MGAPTGGPREKNKRSSEALAFAATTWRGQPICNLMKGGCPPEGEKGPLGEVPKHHSTRKRDKQGINLLRNEKVGGGVTQATRSVFEKRRNGNPYTSNTKLKDTKFKNRRRNSQVREGGKKRPNTKSRGQKEKKPRGNELLKKPTGGVGPKEGGRTRRGLKDKK